MSSGLSEQHISMRNTAQKVSKRLSEDKNVIGIVLVGSVASGKIHDKSDIDFIVVSSLPQNKIISPTKYEETDGYQIEMHYNSAERFKHTFDDEKYRDQGSAWFTANFCLQILRDGLVLQDNTSKLSEWKEKALSWIWRSSEIQPEFTQSQELLQASEERLKQGDILASLTTLRDAFTPLSSAVMMGLNWPSYWRPKDQSRQVSLLKNQYPDLSRLFYEVHSVINIHASWLMESLEELTDLIQRYEWEQGLHFHIKGAKGCLERGNLIGTLLMARCGAYCLGIEILNKMGDKTPRFMFHAPTQLKVIDKTRKHQPNFYQFYEKIHRVDQVDAESISIIIADLRSLLNRLQKHDSCITSDIQQ